MNDKEIEKLITALIVITTLMFVAVFIGACYVKFVLICN